ncbi:hypothetical protein, partial [Staphylococcus capitis]|uniref:hypothetical protein n=1 Tax=Staphylococcus capitis TaxID=29388 RepID=UPI003CFD4F38
MAEGRELSTPEELIDDLTARITAFTNDDPGTVLDPAALITAESLLRLADNTDGGVPLPVAHVVAWLRWCRYLALPEGQDQEDLQAALALFAPIAQVAPEALPEPVRQHMSSFRQPTSADQVTAAAFELIMQSARGGDPA